MASTVSMTVKHRSDQGMSRSLLCHGLDSRREQPHQGSCHIRCCSTPLAAQNAAGDAARVPSKGPPAEYWGGLWKGCLSPFCLRKKLASKMLFSSLFSGCFSRLQCAQRGKKGESTAVISAAFQTHGWFKCRFPNARLVSALFSFMNSRERKQQLNLQAARKS